ncbi:hypothetical protein [Stenotrophomonas maltophilia]|uniref:hypothetical protein n=1 Tax=Stenotrophomonas maltophilia TaxID=40324 RepID=UPI0013D94995|nr:hypothetical protein [Stenotrophomonas maltophilia]
MEGALTINIALATYDSVVLGCDSLSSMMDNVIFPFNHDFAVDADGNPITDANGNFTISLTADKVTQVATTVFGGVRKMFCVYETEDKEGMSVAAVTAGLAILQGITIAEHVKRFKHMSKSAGYGSVADVAQAFFKYFRDKWDAQFAAFPESQRQFMPTIQFILAGYGGTPDRLQVFRIDVQQGRVAEEFGEGEHTGICWGGMANYVERLTRGVDANVVYTATRQIAEALSAQREAVLGEISEALATAGVTLPPDLSFDVTEQIEPTLPWDAHQADIDFGNLSTQYAVELVELLVNTQSGMQRFARGIPTVGGRTHIGVLKRGEGFTPLNEPKLQHLHTGYSHDY